MILNYIPNTSPIKCRMLLCVLYFIIDGKKRFYSLFSLRVCFIHRSTSGVLVDRSTLSFSGSAHRPGSTSPFDNVNMTLGSSFNKTADESGILSRGASQPSSSMSSARSQGAPTTHSSSTVVAEEAGSRATIYSAEDGKN